MPFIARWPLVNMKNYLCSAMIIQRRVAGRRDYIHVEDLAAGHLAALSAFDNKKIRSHNRQSWDGTSIQCS